MVFSFWGRDVALALPGVQQLIEAPDWGLRSLGCALVLIHEKDGTAALRLWANSGYRILQRRHASYIDRQWLKLLRIVAVTINSHVCYPFSIRMLS